MPSYADITTDDPNVVKRWLQNRRLDDALWHVDIEHGSGFGGRMLDFGGGDGALCRRFLSRFPDASVVSYDPSATMLEQAVAGVQAPANQTTETTETTESNQANQANQAVGSTTSLESGSFDVITCCEVVEHLPAAQIDEALEEIFRLLAPTGLLVLGVPNELYLMALGKGVFRLIRRSGEYDARWDTILPAAKGHPREDRPVHDIDGLPFIYPHTGFDYRTTLADLRRHGFQVVGSHGSPIRRGPRFVNTELYLVCRKSIGR
ncbi:MAG: class I SAM-dependent methyltransferase [Acidimicrobiales bacterium]|jgi:SAM-dependent methyltransferase